jgi:hypothetical protein
VDFVGNKEANSTIKYIRFITHFETITPPRHIIGNKAEFKLFLKFTQLSISKITSRNASHKKIKKCWDLECYLSDGALA